MLTGTDELDQEVDAVSVTDDKGQATFSGLLSGTYTLREEQAPEGYLPCHEEWTVEIKHTKAIAHSSNVNDDGSADRNYPSSANESRDAVLENVENIHLRLMYQMEDGWDFIYIQKDGVTQKTDANGKPIGDNGAISGGLGKQEIISEEYDFDGNALTFRLTSDSNTEGYGYYAVISHTDIVVKDSDGNIVDFKDGLLPVENEMVTVKVNKVDVADGRALSGATLQVLDKDGRVVEEWESDGNAHEIKGLNVGETYTLHEETPPVGYTVAGDETFSIDESGKVTYSGTMKDGVMLLEDKEKEAFSVLVNKVDIADGKALSGATLQILDKDGKVVEEWESDGNAHEVKGLNVGETYTLHEETAPDGYTAAEDETFSIDENGKVTYTGTMKNGVMLVEDKKKGEESFSAWVKKVDVADGKALSGATLQILDKDGRIVEEWVSDKNAHEIKGLNIGETYTLHEETAPDGYTAAGDETFSIDENGEVTYTGTMKNGVMLVEDKKKDEETFLVRVNKVDAADGKGLSGATLQILDEDGAIVEEWVSDGSAREITGLTIGKTYTLHEKTAPDGYTVAGDETFRFDKNGEVTYSGTMTEDSVLLLKDEKVTKESKKSRDDTGTGDNSHAALWTTILLMACAALLLSVRRAKKT